MHMRNLARRVAATVLAASAVLTGVACNDAGPAPAGDEAPDRQQERQDDGGVDEGDDDNGNLTGEDDDGRDDG